MAKSIHIYDFIRGLRASIPEFAPGFDDHEGRLVSLEIVCPQHTAAVELHCEEHTEDRTAVQKSVYYLTSGYERLTVYEFKQILQENFPWLKGLVVSRLRVLVGHTPGLRTVIELDIEPQTEDGRFAMPGAYSLELKERGSISPYSELKGLLNWWLGISENAFKELKDATHTALRKL